MEQSKSSPRSPSSSSSSCCLCLLNSKKKSDQNKNRTLNRWGNDEEIILSDMSTFSVKEQERNLKKATKEEERVVKEAEKVVDWIRQESARMDLDHIDSILGDRDDDRKKYK